MAKAERFNISFLVLEKTEEMFLSVSPSFEHGPGIQRDGVTPPRMTDPHSVPRICDHFGLPTDQNLPPTIDPYVQRAGTWTLYHHVKHFLHQLGDEWTIVGVQSQGDLTMNPWHIAYIGKSHLPDQDRELCALMTAGDPYQEPFSSRIYRCLVKWGDEAMQARQVRYECLNLRIEGIRGGYALKINEPDIADRYNSWFTNLPGYNSSTRNIAPLVEFALSGKPVVENGIELSLVNAIDRFEDVRHVFNLPEVKATGFYMKQEVERLNFGEYLLYKYSNVRRAALSAPVIIDLNIEGRVLVTWEDAENALRKRHFSTTKESPTRRGQFRRYTDQADRDKVEIFFPHNVYPFGVIGVQTAHDKEGSPGNIVCLSSGGLSGRVGNTLEGIARIMFDFFGCVDAMVLDEGLDVFFLANPRLDDDSYKYSNEEILQKILVFTKRRIDEDHKGSLRTSASYSYKGGLKEWPLNRDLLQEVETDYKPLEGREVDYSDVLFVEPQRSQMRSVVIFAAKRQ
jgi:hypothetical protein